MKTVSYISMKDSFLKKTEIKPTGGEMNGALTILVDKSRCVNTVSGFGVALTASSCYELNTMPKDICKKFLDDIYGENGLNLSVGRLSIGSSDYSAELYSYDDVKDDTALVHFSTSRDDEYIIPMIKEVLKINPDIFLFASPWSPPGWMKTGGSLCGGYMRRKYIDCYADYIVKFIKEYEKKGIHIQAITPQNEPETEQVGRMPACIWHPELEAEFIISISEKLKKQELDTRIWIYDHNFSGYKRVLWTLQEYPQLAELISGAAFHYYDGGVEMLDNIKKEFPELELHFTEGGPRLFDNYSTDWCKWSTMIARALNHGCRTFTGWNLLLDETGGPNIGPFFCGGLATLCSLTGELTCSGQYRALGHFSKFIKKGAKIYASRLENDVQTIFAYPNPWESVELCAAENTDGSFVLVFVNHNTEKRQLQYFYGGQWWYFEALPDTVTTVVFEK